MRSRCADVPAAGVLDQKDGTKLIGDGRHAAGDAELVQMRGTATQILSGLGHREQGRVGGHAAPRAGVLSPSAATIAASVTVLFINSLAFSTAGRTRLGYRDGVRRCPRRLRWDIIDTRQLKLPVRPDTI